MSWKISRASLSSLQIGLILGIGLLIAFAFGYTGRLIASAELRAQVTQWEAEVELQEEQLEKNRELLEYVQSDEYVIAKARQDLGWVLPGEVAVRVTDHQELAPRAVPATHRDVPSWQAWVDRFFGP